MTLTIRTGNGRPGGPYGGGDPIEMVVHQMSVSFHERLVQLGIPSIWDDYGPGGHDWPYWKRDLRQTLPTLRSVFAHPTRPPSRFTFTAVEPSYSAYGWSVSLRRPVLEFSTLRVTGRRMFTVIGSGRAAVITAPLYRPGQRLRVVVRDARGLRTLPARADRAGRAKVIVSLGPTNAYQQYTLRGSMTPRHWVAARVRIEGLR
jgi:hypothetical protein